MYILAKSLKIPKKIANTTKLLSWKRRILKLRKLNITKQKFTKGLLWKLIITKIKSRIIKINLKIITRRNLNAKS